MSQYFSFIVQSWQDGHEPTMRWRLYCVRSEDEVRSPDASFVVRTWIEDDTEIVRGLVRHVQSGREMQFQSTRRAIEFVRAWLSGAAFALAEGEVETCQDEPAVLDMGESQGGSNGG
jgi:hypothetical protein